MLTTTAPIKDETERQHALDPRASYIVQAPAGSGKTELLTQRFLVLLGLVNVPEEILAITFTKKAAAEMRARIIKTLQTANTEAEPEAPHAQKTWRLAKRALQQNQTLGWNLLTNPNRLRIQTIDSFNTSLTRHLPLLSHFGAPPDIADDAEVLYREAVQDFLTHLEENVDWADAIARLLAHRNNDLLKVQKLLITLLGKRDQWLPHITLNADPMILRETLETHLGTVVSDILTKMRACFPRLQIEELLELARFAALNLQNAENDKHSTILACADLTTLPDTQPEDLAAWQGLKDLLLREDGKKLVWRKRHDKDLGFPAPAKNKSGAYFKNMKDRIKQLIEQLEIDEKLQSVFTELHYAPACDYSENQWEVLSALNQVLCFVVARLRMTFCQHSKIDYIENALAAYAALGSDDSPTDLALALDYQIRHILIDEFQDTSNSQYRLIEKLIAGWETGDGRTLFVVGDPMQSIYRFREADVSNFMRARNLGIGNVKLIPLRLSVNFRSTASIVNWVNSQFQKILPAFEDIATGAVPYSTSIANISNTETNSIVSCHADTQDAASQAQAVVKLIKNTRSENPTGTIAILVRARSHLKELIPALKAAELIYRAIKIDPLDTRPVIQDLMALTRALLNPADRVAWLAVLRAPWCGLTLNDLLALAAAQTQQPILEIIKNFAGIETLSIDGKQRLSRIAPVLLQKMAERKRVSLRCWIESTWLLLGAPACLDQLADLEDVAAYFNLLEKLDTGADLSALDKLADNVSKLFAAPNNQADNTLQIMTIHNAKGLEFDTVILPYLERQPPSEKNQLLMWLEKQREYGDNTLILAPLHATGDKSDAIYNYVKYQHAARIDYEIGRLLYVAATRAKKNLHLFFTPNLKEKPTTDAIEDLYAIKTNSFLQKMPFLLTDRNTLSPFINDSTPQSISIEENKPQRQIKRLKTNWQNPITEIGATTVYKQQKLPGFQLSQDNARHTGIVVHQVLQQISRNGIDWWQKNSFSVLQNYLQSHLSQQGILPHDLAHAVTLAYQAVSNTLQDKRGQWILQPRDSAHSELALTAVINQQVEKLIIDKTFVDENGIRWIIDFKTSHFSGVDQESFLAAEQQKYMEKMQQYQFAIQEFDKKPVYLGLYFPLIAAWREWKS